jgi:hypothetical protein
MYTIRNVSENTKEALNKHAEEHNLTVGEALQQLVEYGLEFYAQNRKSPKKYLTAQDAMKNLPEW